MGIEMADRPSDRAMKAAVEMEIHAACETTTLGKGLALDQAFPAYDDMLQALKDAQEVLVHNPDASQPPRYRAIQASKIIKSALAKAGA